MTKTSIRGLAQCTVHTMPCMMVVNKVIRLLSDNITMFCYLFIYFVLQTVSITSVPASKKKIVSQKLMGHCFSKVIEDN